MGTRANNDVTAGARSIMEYCKSLQAKSGMTATDFAAECGFSRNYWFVRARFDAPLTVSDCERIANVCGMTLKNLLANALGSEATRAYESRERESQITDDLIDRIAAHPEAYDVAANTDPNARLEAETPDE